MRVSGSGAEYALPQMWSRRSITRTFLSSWVATRSATVSPKNPEPTMTMSGRASVTEPDVTRLRGRRPSGPGVGPCADPFRHIGTTGHGVGAAHGRRVHAVRCGVSGSARAWFPADDPLARGRGDLLAGRGARRVHRVPGHGDGAADRRRP